MLARHLGGLRFWSAGANLAYLAVDHGKGGFMRVFMIAAALSVTCPSWAANVDVIDGDTLKVNGKTFRLDGIDAPEKDQVCLDEKGAAWACGIDALARLRDLTA